VRVPTPEEEDAKRRRRERKHLAQERMRLRTGWKPRCLRRASRKAVAAPAGTRHNVCSNEPLLIEGGFQPRIVQRVAADVKAKGGPRLPAKARKDPCSTTGRESVPCFCKRVPEIMGC
jgi:hypothetical protein